MMLKVFPVMSSLFEENEPMGKIKDLKEIKVTGYGELGFFGYQFYRLSTLHFFIPSFDPHSSLSNQWICSPDHPILVHSSDDMMQISNSVYYYGNPISHHIPYFFKTFHSSFFISGGQLKTSTGSLFFVVKVTDPSECHAPTLLPPDPLSSQDYHWYDSNTSSSPISWCKISLHDDSPVISFGSPILSTYGFSNLSHQGNFYHDPFHYLFIEIPYSIPSPHFTENIALPLSSIQLTTVTPFSHL
jgi:hypothetical protein